MASELVDLSEWFGWFAEHEAAGRSALYADLARAVSEDEEMLAALCELPPAKRQPALLLAAVRHVCGLAHGWPEFRESYFERQEEITAVILSRRTQTNEPARCATLLPLLATLPQPLALIEVGAAAGLCLLIDRYGYDYGKNRTVASIRDTRDAPVFACKASPSTPIPTGPITVAWRAGLDLNPIDASDAEQAEWLKTLVWPGEGRRLELLQAALAVARREPPRVSRGDLRDGIGELACHAPNHATLVVFHTAVLGYLDSPEERERFGEHTMSLGARWISNEGYGVLPMATRPAEQPWPAGPFLLSLDNEPVARTDPHGAWIHWL